MGPLSGVRVLDFTWAWAGPFGTLQLAHLGAEVIRIESPAHPCVSRTLPPFADDVPGPNRAGYFNQYNQGKRSVALNLRHPKGLDIAYKLARISDVVAENFACGVADRIGVGYSKLRSIRPDIIMLSISGYGQTGPYKGFIGYGGPASALAGLYFATGHPGGGPCEIGTSYPDPNAGAFGALAVIGALLHRDQTGEGQYIDLSQWEAGLCVAAEGLLQYQMLGTEPERRGNQDPRMAPNECYKALGDDDKWVSIAVGSEQEWRALCNAMDRPELADDARFSDAPRRKAHEAELNALITDWTRSRDRWEVAEALQKAGVAAFPSMSNKDLTTDAHLKERGFLVELDHPEIGRRVHAGIPWTMSGTPCEVRAPAPLRGGDTDAVLGDLLGFSREDIEALRKEGALG